MEQALHYIGTLLLLAGGFLVLTSAVGLFRLPDISPRLHAASVADGLGACVVVLGLAVLSGSWAVAGKLLLLALFLLVTGPTACHALIRAAIKDAPLPKKPRGKDDA